MKPIFFTEGLFERGYARIVGNNHLKMDLYDANNPKHIFPAIAFNLGDRIDLVSSKSPIDVLYTIEENEWNGNISLQLNIKDIRPSEKN